MEKGYPPQESAPPYPGPPMNYYGGEQQPVMYPHPGFPAAPPPAVYQGGVAFSPAPVAPPTTVTHVVVAPALHDVPGQTVCVNCQRTVITRTEHTAGLMAWAICAGLALFGCLLCCCIPFCLESCQDVKHYCPSCNKVIYIYKRM